jgi:hypothetical protein
MAPTPQVYLRGFLRMTPVLVEPEAQNPNENPLWQFLYLPNTRLPGCPGMWYYRGGFLFGKMSAGDVYAVNAAVRPVASDCILLDTL